MRIEATIKKLTKLQKIELILNPTTLINYTDIVFKEYSSILANSNNLVGCA